jgi:osmotically-inducible protein OsmY
MEETIMTGIHVINRTDAEIFADARHALDERPSVPATVRVHVEHGVATLTGTARLVAERSEAAEVVGRIAGVRDVMNDIVVSQPPNPAGFEAPDERG